MRGGLDPSRELSNERLTYTKLGLYEQRIRKTQRSLMG